MPAEETNKAIFIKKKYFNYLQLLCTEDREFFFPMRGNPGLSKIFNFRTK